MLFFFFESTSPFEFPLLSTYEKIRLLRDRAFLRYPNRITLDLRIFGSSPPVFLVHASLLISLVFMYFPGSLPEISRGKGAL